MLLPENVVKMFNIHTQLLFFNSTALVLLHCMLGSLAITKKKKKDTKHNPKRIKRKAGSNLVTSVEQGTPSGSKRLEFNLERAKTWVNYHQMLAVCGTMLETFSAHTNLFSSSQTVQSKVSSSTHHLTVEQVGLRNGGTGILIQAFRPQCHTLHSLLSSLAFN